MTGRANGLDASLLFSEKNLAERVGLERRVRGWSTGELAARMTEVGHPMNQSAVWRIENGAPRRRINLDEALGFSIVFELPLEELMSPPQEAMDFRSRQLVQEVVDAYRASREARERLDRAQQAVAAYVDAHPEYEAAVREAYLRFLGDADEARYLAHRPVTAREEGPRAEE